MHTGGGEHGDQKKHDERLRLVECVGNGDDHKWIRGNLQDRNRWGACQRFLWDGFGGVYLLYLTHESSR